MPPRRQGNPNKPVKTKSQVNTPGPVGRSSSTGASISPPQNSESVNSPTSGGPEDEPSPVQKTVNSISDALDKLDLSFNELNEKSSEVENLGPTSTEVETQLQQLRQDVHKQGKIHKKELENVKKWIREDAKEMVFSTLKPEISSTIRSEIENKVKEEVELQFQDHVPITLQQQLEETEKQLEDVKISLGNSESRRINNSIDLSILQEEPLAPILKADGTKSDLYPADVISLLCYDSEVLKKLLSDYDLPADDIPEINFSRFMAHIGIKHQVVPLTLNTNLYPPSPPPPTAI